MLNINFKTSGFPHLFARHVPLLTFSHKNTQLKLNSTSFSTVINLFACLESVKCKLESDCRGFKCGFLMESGEQLQQQRKGFAPLFIVSGKGPCHLL